MCYRNGYGCSYCGQGYEIKDESANVCRIHKGMSEEELSEAVEILDKICTALTLEQLHVEDEDPVFMVAYTPGEPMEIITEEEADEYLSCYGIDDVIEQAPGMGLVISYNRDLLFSVGNQKYLDGTILIYAVDDEGDTMSLEIDDIYGIQKMIRDRTISVTQGDDEMPVFSMN